jgi:hypothetical protein
MLGLGALDKKTTFFLPRIKFLTTSMALGLSLTPL